jgi:hypothetical protein
MESEVDELMEMMPVPCPTCIDGAPDHYGCTDCMNGGWMPAYNGPNEKHFRWTAEYVKVLEDHTYPKLYLSRPWERPVEIPGEYGLRVNQLIYYGYLDQSIDEDKNQTVRHTEKGYQKLAWLKGAEERARRWNAIMARGWTRWNAPGGGRDKLRAMRQHRKATRYDDVAMF